MKVSRRPFVMSSCASHSRYPWRIAAPSRMNVPMIGPRPSPASPKATSTRRIGLRGRSSAIRRRLRTRRTMRTSKPGASGRARHLPARQGLRPRGRRQAHRCAPVPGQVRRQRRGQRAGQDHGRKGAGTLRRHQRDLRTRQHRRRLRCSRARAPADRRLDPLGVAGYDRHLWVIEGNPSGVFAQFNPAISC